MSQDVTCERSQDPIHGFIYQLKLLMLFLHRGIKHKYDFHLHTETKAAGSFDDLVFQYTQGNEKFFRLLQAKHSLDETKKITVADLFAGPQQDQKYSLIKYFYSYMKSKKESMFQGGSFKDLIICTNVDFNIEDFKNNDINVHEIKDEDSILNIDMSNAQKEPKRYRFDKSFIEKLKPKLEEYNDLSIAKKLVKFILGNTQLSKRNLPDYGPALISYVIDKKNKSFSDNFVRNINLSERTSKFREMLNFEIKKQSKDKLNLDTLHEAMIKKKELFDDKQIALNIHENLERNPDKKRNNGEQERWPPKNINVADILEFLNLLIFAVNQPNEDELGKAIKMENMEVFNKITTETIYESLFQHMVDFLQNKQHIDGARIGFWSYTDGKKFIDDTRFEIIRLQLSGFRNHLDSVNFKFKEMFSKSINDFNNSKETMWLLTSETTWLSSLAVYQSIKNYTQVKNIFIYRWNDLLDNNGEIILDLKHLENFVIIISCLQLIGSEQFIAKIVADIKQIFFETIGDLKKIVVVASEKHEVLRKFKQEFQHFYGHKLNIKFSDMDSTSQRLLLENKNIAFQGRQKINLQKLLNIKHHEYQQQMEILNLDSTDIELLLRNSEVKIFNETNDFNSLTYKPHKFVTFDSIIQSITRNRNDLYAFYGDDEEIKLMFHNRGIDLIKFDSLDKNIKHRFFLLELETESREFNLLCKMIYDYETYDKDKPALHKLKYVGNKLWIWMQTFDIRFYITRYHRPNIIGSRILNVLSEANSSDFILFSGVIQSKILKEVFSCYIQDHEYAFDNNYDVVKMKKTARKKFNFLSTKLKETQQYDPNDIYLQVTKLYNKKSVHWIKIVKDSEHILRYEWQESVGNIKTINSRRDVKRNFLPEANLIHLNQRLILLTDGPGTGKSCTLTRIMQNLEKYKPTSLIIKVDLNKLQRCSDSFCIESKHQLIQLLFRVLKKSSTYEIEKKIIEYKMEYPGQLILLFDGLDEVIIGRRESALSMIHFIIQETKANLWITTRSQNTEKLQNSLCVLNYSFQELSNRDKCSFLIKFLRISLIFSNRHSLREFFYECGETILHHFCDTFINFSKNPSILHLVVEKYMDVLIECDTEDISTTKIKIQKINLADAFKSFLYRMYEVYFAEKIKIIEWFDDDSKGILQDAYSNAYRCLAAKLCGAFYSITDESKLHKDISLDTLAKIGLIEIYYNDSGEFSKKNHMKMISFGLRPYDNVYVRFIHKSLHQFFVAEYVFLSLKAYPRSEVLWKFLINTILCNIFTLRIFDNYLEEDTKLFNLPSKKYQQTIIFRLIRKNQAALWKAAMLDYMRTVEFLLQCFLVKENFPIAMEEILLLPHNFFGSGIPKLKVILEYVKENKARYENIVIISDIKFGLCKSQYNVT